jgi:transposase InsO family protein
MCRVLEVSVAGFYAYLKRPMSWRAVIDEVLMAHIRIAFAESGETYGAPRMLQELQEIGLPTSTKRVARLMREDGLVARPRKRRRVVTTNSNHAEPIAPNLVARKFDVNGVAVNRVWVVTVPISRVALRDERGNAESERMRQAVIPWARARRQERGSQSPSRRIECVGRCVTRSIRYASMSMPA